MRLCLCDNQVMGPEYQVARLLTDGLTRRRLCVLTAKEQMEAEQCVVAVSGMRWQARCC